MLDRITDWMDLVGTLAIVVGITAGLWLVVGVWSLVFGGALLLLASRVLLWLDAPDDAPSWWQRLVGAVT